MKRCLVLVLALAMALTACSAFAEVKDFQFFKVDVPAGWTATETSQEAGVSSVAITKEGVAALTVGVAPTGGASLVDIATALSGALNGTKPEADDKGNQVFTCNDGNTVVIVNANEESQMWISMSITGIDKAEDEMSAIMDSIEFKE